jgi:hypothetical protein
MKTRAYFLNRAALHQRLSALRHKHFEETASVVRGYGETLRHTGKIADRLRDLSNSRQMHAEIASDYMEAVAMLDEMAALARRALPELTVQVPDGMRVKRLDGHTDVWRDGAWRPE